VVRPARSKSSWRSRPRADLPEQEHRAVDLREGLERGLQDRAHLALQGLLFRVVRAGGERVHRATTKSDHLRATVTGERDGETIRVSTIAIE
jgi:hypothetical protein